MKRVWTLLERLLHPPKWVLFLLNIPMGGMIVNLVKFRKLGRIMNAVTGGGMWCSVILIAVTMLLCSRKMKEVKSVDPLRE